ncbi:MAG: CopG family transcriptional regulator [Sphingomonas sp.]|nr:CopG family transcriptional regulator [Sphingomonas sp.]NUR37460.1 CopG family transcriptional regulator [Sphingomonas sp.]
MARADLVRHQLFLSRELSERLEALARGPGASKSRILAAAVAAWLDRKGADALEHRFMARLDRLSNQLARIERNGQIELESLALFVRYMLTVNAPLPEGDKAAQAIGRDRFKVFVERVGQQLASGRLTFVPEDPE